MFGLIELIIARHEPLFDHYSFVAIQRPAWDRITADLKRLPDAADDTGVARMAAELADWVRERLADHDCVSVLGI